MTGVEKIPLPVWKNQGSPPPYTPTKLLQPVLRLSCLKVGQINEVVMADSLLINEIMGRIKLHPVDFLPAWPLQVNARHDSMQKWAI